MKVLKPILTFFIPNDPLEETHWELSFSDVPCRMNGELLLFEQVPNRHHIELFNGDKWIKGRRIDIDTRRRCLGCGDVNPGGACEFLLCGPCYNMGLRVVAGELKRLDSFDGWNEREHKQHIERLDEWSNFIRLAKKFEVPV